MYLVSRTCYYYFILFYNELLGNISVRMYHETISYTSLLVCLTNLVTKVAYVGKQLSSWWYMILKSSFGLSNFLIKVCSVVLSLPLCGSDIVFILLYFLLFFLLFAAYESIIPHVEKVCLPANLSAKSNIYIVSYILVWIKFE